MAETWNLLAGGSVFIEEHLPLLCSTLSLDRKVAQKKPLFIPKYPKK
jgi:hypothetical protein